MRRVNDMFAKKIERLEKLDQERASWWDSVPTKSNTETTEKNSHSNLPNSPAAINPNLSVMPSLDSVKKYDRLARSARHCNACGGTDTFDGIMFTVDSSRRTCDDCYG